MPPKKAKRTKLSKAQKKRASRFIAEEVRTGKYEQKQAVAIGISRASRAPKGAKKQRRTGKRHRS